MIKIKIFEYKLAYFWDLLCTITFRKQIDITLHFFDQIDLILVAFILFYQIIAKTVHFILNVYFEYVLRSKHEKYFVLYVMNQIWSIKNRIKNDLIMLLVFHRLLRPLYI